MIVLNYTEINFFLSVFYIVLGFSLIVLSGRKLL